MPCGAGSSVLASPKLSAAWMLVGSANERYHLETGGHGNREVGTLLPAVVMSPVVAVTPWGSIFSLSSYSELLPSFPQS